MRRDQFRQASDTRVFFFEYHVAEAIEQVTGLPAVAFGYDRLASWAVAVGVRKIELPDDVRVIEDNIAVTLALPNDAAIAHQISIRAVLVFEVDLTGGID